MDIRSLSGTSIAALTAIFNKAFENYFAKVNFTEEDFAEKLFAESVDLSLSVGIFEDEQLVAFILTGIDTINGELVAYNAGTGVIEEFRGQRLTQKMYDYLIPVLKHKGVMKTVLEVIRQNDKAIKAYERVGYSIVRTLNCYKTTGELPSATDINYRFADSINKELVDRFCDISPTWQHSVRAIEKTMSKKIVEVMEGEKVIGFVVFKPKNGRVLLMGVDKDYRRKGIGTTLFNLVKKNSDAAPVVVNLDSIDKGIHAFLEKMGLELFLSQYEMTMSV